MLPAERPGYAAPPDLAARRAGLAAAAASGMWRSDPAPVEQVLRGVRVLRFDPPQAARATILHFHGGAFRIGMPEQIAPFAAALARRCGVALVCPAYRLAPEHPFPAALHDGQAVIERLGEGPLILSGDSAGGALAAALAGPNNRGLLLFSPWLDLTVTSASFEKNAATDPLFSAAAAHESAALYLQGWPADDPRASPLFGKPGRLPPTFVGAGTGEVLAEDARRLHRALAMAGTSIRLHLVPDMDHVAVTRGLNLPGAAETFEAAAAFVDSLLDGPHRPSAASRKAVDCAQDSRSSSGS